jgi:hypothetical protein
MTRLDVTKRHEDDDLIDRIVDGELAGSELRAGLEQLERMPDGWKRCALAFLEAQCWRQSLRAMDGLEMVRGNYGSFVVPGAPSPAHRRRLWVRGVIAAAIAIVSFSMGWLGRATRPVALTDQAMIAGASKPIPAAALEFDMPAPIRYASAQPSDVSIRPASAGVASPLMKLQIGTKDAKAEVPILAGPGIDAEWVMSQPPPVSEHAQVMLQQRGYQVDQLRRLITTTLPDGRRVTFPIDQVQIRYTGAYPL